MSLYASREGSDSCLLDICHGHFIFLSFLIVLAQSNFDHYARECEFGILKKKTKQKNKKNLSAVFLTK